MWRVVIAFLLGVGCTLLALREIPPLNKDRKIEASVGRYQFVHGTMPMSGFGTVTDIKVQILLDTATGRTWHLGIEGEHGNQVWHFLAPPPE